MVKVDHIYSYKKYASEKQAQNRSFTAVHVGIILLKIIVVKHEIFLSTSDDSK